jgi:hypothetical protein
MGRDGTGQVEVDFRCEHDYDSHHTLTLRKYSLSTALGGTGGIPRASPEFRDTLHLSLSLLSRIGQEDWFYYRYIAFKQGIECRLRAGSIW